MAPIESARQSLAVLRTETGRLDALDSTPAASLIRIPEIALQTRFT